jgi:type IV secretory pathway VirB2 component (pilin)
MAPPALDILSESYCLPTTVKLRYWMGMVSFYQSPGTDSALADSADWIRDLLTGSVGTTIAVIAIAWLGFALLQGRATVRDGARIILGCFILFGAPQLAASIAHMAHSEQSAPATSAFQPAPKPVALPTKPPVFDPYAGASVPNQ